MSASDHRRTPPVFTLAEQRAMADDPDCPPTLREALLEGVAADRGDDDHGLP